VASDTRIRPIAASVGSRGERVGVLSVGV